MSCSVVQWSAVVMVKECQRKGEEGQKGQEEEEDD